MWIFHIFQIMTIAGDGKSNKVNCLRQFTYQIHFVNLPMWGRFVTIICDGRSKTNLQAGSLKKRLTAFLPRWVRIMTIIC